jgi:hypothetical protein
MTPTSGPRLSAIMRRRGGRHVVGWLGRGSSWAGWAARGEEKKRKRPSGLGCAEGKKEREGGEREREWAGPKEKKREKKEIYLNAFEFEFEI